MWQKNRFAFLALAFLISFNRVYIAKTAALQNSHIFGGRVVQTNQYPWVVTVEMTTPGMTRATCGGALLRTSDNSKKADIVITAAHCVSEYVCDEDNQTKCAWQPRRPETVIVTAGNHLLKKSDKEEEGRSAVKLEIHPDWKMNYTGCLDDSEPASACHTHDLALVKIAGAFRFSKGIAAIDAATDGQSIANRERCTVAGWGLYEHVNDSIKDPAHVKPQTSNALRAVDVGIPDTAECADAYKETADKFDKLLCALAEDTYGSSCVGDSGGPLWCRGADGKPILHGVVSGSSGTCGPTLIAVYVNVAKYASWIKETAQRLSTVS